MKKKVIIAVVAVLVVVLGVAVFAISQGNATKEEENLFNAVKKEKSTVVATVDGTKIYKEDIDIMVANEKLSKQQLINAGGDVSAVTEKTEKEFLDELVKSAVLANYAKEKGFAADRKEAEKSARKAWELTKTDSDTRNYEFLTKYIKERNMTEEDFIAEITESTLRRNTETLVYNDFVKKNGLEGKSRNDIAPDWDKFVNELTKKANVKYY